MSYGLAEGTLAFCLLRIDMNPLMVECRIGKHIDAFLTEFHIIADTQLLSFVLLEVFKGINYYFTHNVICLFVISCAKVQQKVHSL